MNEGWATYWHSKLLTEKILDASEIIDYADHAAGVLVTSGGRLNPYKLGVELFRHIEERWDSGPIRQGVGVTATTPRCEAELEPHGWASAKRRSSRCAPATTTT